MAAIPPAVFDPRRLEILSSYGILDTAPEVGFDDVVMLARQICGTPIALVSLVESNRQWFKAAVGLGACETPIDQSVCAHALAGPETLNIPDLTADARTRDNALVTGEPFIRFYAGAPLIVEPGVAIGTVCVIDTVARPGGLNAEQIAALEALARQVVTLLGQRRLLALYDDRARIIEAEAAERRAAEAAREISEERYRLLFNSLDAGFCVIEMRFDSDGFPSDYKFVETNEAFVRQTGLKNAIGRWMRELAPGHEQHWFDTYGRVALTGEPARFESQADALGNRCYDVHAFRIGEGHARQVAILFTDVSDRKRAERQQQVLNDELGHRMKNSMAMVQAIAGQTLRSATDRDAVQAFMQRLQAMSHAHDVLLAQSWSSADLAEVIGGAVRVQADPARVRLSGPQIHLDPKSALSMSLLLHELGTNAVKYGALSVPEGIVEIDWARDGSDLVLKWTETGGPPAVEPARTGLGTRLIDIGIVGTRNVKKSYGPSGFRAEFRAPLQLVEHKPA